MRIITDATLINNRQWKTLAATSPVASIFQTTDFYHFISELKLYKTRVIAVEDNGMLQGVVVCLIQSEGSGLKRWCTSRAIVNGGPLLDKDISHRALRALLEATIKQLKKECVYIETRNLNDYSYWKVTFVESHFAYIPHNNYHVNTSTEELALKHMDTNRRRAIRRAKENGATISVDLYHLPAFYDILKELYHTKVHKPLPPYSFFEKFSSAPFTHFFFILNPQNEVIGGHMTLSLETRVLYSWYCCGQDHKYHDLHPSVMANYAAISYAAQQGIARYDMMGAGSPKKKYSVRDFKSQFGGTLVEHGRFLFVCSPFLYHAGKTIINLLNK